MTGVLIRREKFGHRLTDTQEECHVMREGKTGVMSCKPRNIKGCWQPPEAGKSQVRMFHRAFRENMTLLMP